MYNEKKYKFLKRIEMILPWLVLLPGVPAIYYFSASGKEYRSFGSSENYRHLSEMFDLFYNLVIIVGIIIVFIELIISIVCLILCVVNLIKYKKIEENVKSNFKLFMGSLFYSIGTLILMFFVNAFTYGMGV